MPEDSKLLEGLVGRHVTDIDIAEGTVSLRFDGGWLLAIYNPHVISSCVGTVEPMALGQLIGKKIETVTCANDQCSFELTDGLRIRVDLSEEAFTGPEAMLMTDPSGQMVVWN